MDIEIDPQTLRETIQGIAPWTRCVDCNTLGYLMYNEDNDMPVSADIWEGEESEMCQTCDGVGYVLRYWL